VNIIDVEGHKVEGNGPRLRGARLEKALKSCPPKKYRAEPSRVIQVSGKMSQYDVDRLAANVKREQALIIGENPHGL
jgi:hypothetical protein